MNCSPFSSSDSETEGEATRVFSKHMEMEFKKAFPLKEELEARAASRSAIGRTVMDFLTPTPMKLNLDETIPSAGGSPMRTQAKLQELSAELALAKRKCERLGKTIEKAEEKEKKTSAENEQLTRANAELRAKLREVEEESKDLRSRVISSDDRVEWDTWKAAAQRQHTWLQWKDAQLNCLAQILLKERLWTKERRFQVRKAYKMMQPESLSLDEARELERGSDQEFMGVDGLNDSSEEEEEEEENVKEENEIIEEEANPNDTTIRGDYDSKMELCTTDDSVLDMSIVPPEPSFREEPSNEESAAFDSTLSERDERIMELECKLESMHDQLTIYKGRVTKYEVLKEEKASLLHRIAVLRQHYDEAIREMESVKKASVEHVAKMTSPEPNKHQRAEAALVVDKITNLQMKLTDMEMLLEKERRLRDEALQTANDEKVAKEVAVLEVSALKKELERRELELAALIEDLERARDEIKRLAELEEEKERTALMEGERSTDAGDTTKIVHMMRNPLEMAREEMREQEEAARKRSLSTETGEGPLAKRAREEDEGRVAELEEKLRRAEREKQKADKIYSDISHRYRDVICKLTGFQIVMKSEEFVHVISELDPLKQKLVFTVCDQVVSLVESHENSPLIPSAEVRFADEAREMLGGLRSVPAFLAAVQLRMARAAADEETLMVSRGGDDTLGGGGGAESSEMQHTFSVLQED